MTEIMKEAERVYEECGLPLRCTKEEYLKAVEDDMEDPLTKPEEKELMKERFLEACDYVINCFKPPRNKFDPYRFIRLQAALKKEVIRDEIKRRREYEECRGKQ